MKKVRIGKHFLFLGDCLEVMPRFPSHKVDLILCDLPYGTTACVWDTILPFSDMWKNYERLVKKYHPIVLFASQPFTSKLIVSNLDLFKYQWVWEKSKAGNFVHAKNMPLKFHEDICVFSDGVILHEGQSDKRMPYYPQGLIKVDKTWTRPRHYENGHNMSRSSNKLTRCIEFTNYPTSVLKFGNSRKSDRGLHPTQKPVALMRYIVRTYTQLGEVVLDNCMGSGTSGEAAILEGRRFVGIEKTKEYFDVSCDRLNEAYKTFEYLIKHKPLFKK